MLILSRLVNEQVVLYQGGVEVARLTVLDVRGNNTRLGIEASKDIKILRAELEQKGDDEQARSA